jgi:hypothetical protein
VLSPTALLPCHARRRVLRAMPATRAALATVPATISDTLAAACMDEVASQLVPGLRGAALPLLAHAHPECGIVLQRAGAVDGALAAAQQMLQQQAQISAGGPPHCTLPSCLGAPAPHCVPCATRSAAAARP